MWGVWYPVLDELEYVPEQFFTDTTCSNEYPILTCCQDLDHTRDTVFNVCLQVDSVNSITQSVFEKSGLQGSPLQRMPFFNSIWGS